LCGGVRFGALYKITSSPYMMRQPFIFLKKFPTSLMMRRPGLSCRRRHNMSFILSRMLHAETRSEGVPRSSGAVAPIPDVGGPV
jgi:hypothetical protein